MIFPYIFPDLRTEGLLRSVAKASLAETIGPDTKPGTLIFAMQKGDGKSLLCKKEKDGKRVLTRQQDKLV